MSLVRQLAAHHKRKMEKEFHPAPLNPSPESIKCDTLWINATNIVNLPPMTSAQTNGIWPNLTANMLAFALALALFILLKKKMFNKAPEAQPTASSNGRPTSRLLKTTNIGTAIYGNQAEDTPLSDHADAEKRTRLWYWRLKDAISESDYELLTKGGLGALEYVRFQRYTLLFTVMVCTMSLCVILPINLAGHLFTDSMGQMSLANIEPSSSKLWFHVLLTLVLFPMAIAAMRQFGLQVPQNSLLPYDTNSRTVMFSGLPSTGANSEMIKHHFREAYPHYTIEDVSLTFDVKHLAQLEEELRMVEEAAKYCDDLPAGSEAIVVKVGGVFCGCFGSKVDGEKYYALRKSQLNQQIEYEFRRNKQINPVFFVTFANNFQAQEVYCDNQRFNWCRGQTRPQSLHSNEVKSNNWTAFHAPDPSNVKWNNLNQSGWTWYLKALLINLVLLGIIAALTIAIVVLNFGSLPSIQQSRNFPAVSQISPALIMLLLQKVVPKIIRRGVAWIGYWSRPKELIAEMRFIFTDLILAIVIIPSMALLGADALHFLGRSTGGRPRPECISLPDNGSLYINYLIFFAFISTAMSLFRLNVLFSYLVRSCRARSLAEEAVASRVDLPFAYSENYSSFLTAFTVTVVYSFINPMVSLFGVIALLMRYLLDQYMLCNVYKRSSAPTSVHAVAINQFFSSVLLQLVFMSVFFVLRNGLDGYVVILVLALLVYGCIFISIAFFRVCEKVSLFQLLNQGDAEPQDGTLELGTASYLPPVLQRQSRWRNASNSTSQPS